MPPSLKVRLVGFLVTAGACTVGLLTDDLLVVTAALLVSGVGIGLMFAADLEASLGGSPPPPLPPSPPSYLTRSQGRW